MYFQCCLCYDPLLPFGAPLSLSATQLVFPPLAGVLAWNIAWDSTIFSYKNKLRIASIPRQGGNEGFWKRGRTRFGPTRVSPSGARRAQGRQVLTSSQVALPMLTELVVTGFASWRPDFIFFRRIFGTNTFARSMPSRRFRGVLSAYRGAQLTCTMGSRKIAFVCFTWRTTRGCVTYAPIACG